MLAHHICDVASATADVKTGVFCLLFDCPVAILFSWQQYRPVDFLGCAAAPVALRRFLKGGRALRLRVHPWLDLERKTEDSCI